MDYIDYILFILLALLSEIIGTVSGFGSSILFVPIASIFFEFQMVLGITAVFHVFSNISKIFLFRKGFNLQIVLRLGIPSVIMVLLGSWLTTLIQLDLLELTMNIMLTALGIYMIVSFNKQIKQNNFNLYLGGSVSGLLAGLFGTGGAIRGITLTAFHLPKTIFITTSAIIDLGVDSSRAFIYLVNGYFEKPYIFLIPFLVGVSVLGSLIGKIILKYTSEKIFRYIVLLVIISTSIFQTIHYLTK